MSRENTDIRVTTGDGRFTFGMGFLVSKGFAMTCTHVVADALNAREVRVGDKVWIECPRIPQRNRLRATVHKSNPTIGLEELPTRPEAEAGPSDITVLRIEDNIPPGAMPIWGQEVQTSRDHRFTSFAMPGADQFGSSPDGVIRERGGTPWIEVVARDKTDFIESGFSGAAAWDLDLGAVIGMVVARRANGKAFLIPTRYLRQTWPSLHIGTGPVARGAAPTDESRMQVVIYADREPQTKTMLKALMEIHGAQSYLKRKPIICVVHGDDQEDHDHLEDRLEMDTLPTALQNAPGSRKIQPVNLSDLFWILPQGYEGELREKIWQVLNPNETGDPTPSAREICAFINRVPRPVFLSSHFHSTTFTETLGELLLKWFSVWNDIASHGLTQCVGIILSFHFHEREHAQSFWAAWTRRNSEEQSHQTLCSFLQSNFGLGDPETSRVQPPRDPIVGAEYRNIQFVCLPKLTPLDLETLDDWSRRRLGPIIQIERSRLVEEIRRLFEDHFQSGTMRPLKSLHMRVFLERARSYLSNQVVLG